MVCILAKMSLCCIEGWARAEGLESEDENGERSSFLLQPLRARLSHAQRSPLFLGRNRHCFRVQLFFFFKDEVFFSFLFFFVLPWMVAYKKKSRLKIEN